MKKPTNSRRALLVAAVTVAAAMGVTAGVQAAIPDAGGVIHGCYKTNQGTLRVIDTDQGQTCTNGEAPLNWNQTGPAGPQGPQGPQGPKGDPGPTYSAGTGLSLSGNTFGIQGSYQLPQGCSANQSPYLQNVFPSHPWGCFTAANANESCASSKFVNGIDANGDVTCAAPPSGGGGGSSGPDFWIARNLGIQIDTPQDQDTTITTLSLPAGTFLLDTTGDAADDPGGDGRVQMQCTYNVGTNYENIWVDDGDAPHVPFAVHDIVTLASPADVAFSCYDYYGSDHVANVITTAEAVGSLH